MTKDKTIESSFADMIKIVNYSVVLDEYPDEASTVPMDYVKDTPNQLMPELRATQQHLHNIKKTGISTNLSLIDAKEAMQVLALIRKTLDTIIDQANNKLTIKEIP